MKVFPCLLVLNLMSSMDGFVGRESQSAIEWETADKSSGNSPWRYWRALRSPGSHQIGQHLHLNLALRCRKRPGSVCRILPALVSILSTEGGGEREKNRIFISIFNAVLQDMETEVMVVVRGKSEKGKQKGRRG